MGEETEARLTKLETTIEHQSNTIDEISAVITQQWRTIEGMQRRLDALATRFVSLEDQESAPAENSRPPHW